MVIMCPDKNTGSLRPKPRSLQSEEERQWADVCYDYSAAPRNSVLRWTQRKTTYHEDLRLGFYLMGYIELDE